MMYIFNIYIIYTHTHAYRQTDRRTYRHTDIHYMHVQIFGITAYFSQCLPDPAQGGKLLATTELCRADWDQTGESHGHGHDMRMGLPSDSIKDGYVKFQFPKFIFLYDRSAGSLSICTYMYIDTCNNLCNYIVLLCITDLFLWDHCTLTSLAPGCRPIFEVLSPTRSASGGRGTVALQPCLHRPGGKRLGIQGLFRLQN